ncbi:MAG TPA: zf-HC2 domain-containing protein [Acidimicrobiales bacterium]|jgi:predicted anti-sigma-YlaC factor YlaD|nr:zf-HC2 domain-containing protein [Acidimicrobiales bacterium]
MTVLSCAEARSLVSDYIDGELDASASRDLESHLETCIFCPPLYASLVTALATLRATEVVGPAVDRLVQRVVAAVTNVGPVPYLGPERGVTG